MSEREDVPGDPTTMPFWNAASEHRLIIQHCLSCGAHQFYPRPFCLSCRDNRLEWVSSSGLGAVYSMTTVRIPVIPDLSPPYVVALVQLDEGPRVVTNIVGGECKIGDRVRLAWKERVGNPPLPVFEPFSAGRTERV